MAGRRDPVTRGGEFAVDAPVPPSGVVARHFQCQVADGSRDRRASGTVAGVAPAALDDSGVPVQQGARRDDQAKLAAVPVRQPAQRTDDRTVGPRQPRGAGMALEHGELVAQDQDLGVLGQI